MLNVSEFSRFYKNVKYYVIFLFDRYLKMSNLNLTVNDLTAEAHFVKISAKFNLYTIRRRSYVFSLAKRTIKNKSIGSAFVLLLQ